jgi:hypothetical protein
VATSLAEDPDWIHHVFDHMAHEDEVEATELLEGSGHLTDMNRNAEPRSGPACGGGIRINPLG